MRAASLLRPWYLYRPSQVLRRIAQAVESNNSPSRVAVLPWGCPIEVDTRETIGRAIWTTGVHDLPVAEVLLRLTQPDDLAVDAGANIGSLTGLLACRAAEVWAFEPHPDIFRALEGNIRRIEGLQGFAPCRLFQTALSEAAGTAALLQPEGFEGNHGLARLTSSTSAVLTAPTLKLDEMLGGRSIGVLKIDVEGHEAAVLRGAAASLAAGRIRDIVFEDHEGPGSETFRILFQFGFDLFAIDWRLNGPVLASPAAQRRANEAANYLATREAGRAVDRCASRGWKCLSGGPRPIGRIGGVR